MANRLSKLAIVALAGATLAGSIGQASAFDHRSFGGGYSRDYRGWHHGHRGLGVGGAVAAGVIGGAALGAAAGAYGPRPAYEGSPGYYDDGY